VGRTVIIGDVHGCARELEALLGAVGVVRDDAVHFVGDLVARGPDTRRVLEIARELGALSVVGNHEQRLLHARAARARGERGPKLGPSHTLLMRTLTDEEWAELDAMPLYHDLAPHGVRIVHAGVAPGVPIEQQDPYMLTHIRSLDENGAPSASLGTVPWGARYSGPPHVVFGHNAPAKIQLHDWATGVDSGCVYGGALTALVLPPDAPVPPVAERRDCIVSVPAQRVYFSHSG